MRNRRSWLTGIIYAFLGFTVAHICLLNSGAGNKIGEVLGVFLLPGAIPLFLVSGPAMAGGAYVLFYLTNPLAYFGIGYLFGARLQGLLRLILVSITLLLVMSALGYYRGIMLPQARFRQNIEHYRQIFLDKVSREPNNIRALFSIGHYNMLLGEDLEAIKYFERVVQLESKKAAYSSDGQLSLLHLGTINERLGRPDQALVYYGLFMKTDPYLSLAEANHAKEYLERNKAGK